MNPKKVKTLYNIVSDDLNIKSDLTEDLIEFYYKEVRTLLTELKYPRINIDSLGQFVVKPVMVDKTISRLDKVIDGHDTSTFKAYHNLKAMEIKLELLNQLNIKIKEETNKKLEFFKNKNNEKSTEGDMGQ